MQGIKFSEYFQGRMQELENQTLISIVELLGQKIQQRFHKASDAYMYFSQYGTLPDPNKVNINYEELNNTISLDDFIKASDQLKVKLSQNQAQEIFNTLDLNKDGRLDYKEFCILAIDEQRRQAFKQNNYLNGRRCFLTPVRGGHS